MTFNGPELEKTLANYAALSPVSFLKRVAHVYPDYTAVRYGSITRSWIEVSERCKRLASALSQRGIKRGDTVALLAPNIPEALECALGLPLIGAVLNANNTRIDVETLSYILMHGEARVLLVDTEYSNLAAQALSNLENDILVVDIRDSQGPDGNAIGSIAYETLLEEGEPDFPCRLPSDEWDALSLNYTSGTTGRPKGVVYSHRGAWTNSVNNTITWGMPHHPVYLWTLPMFHCNGWCFPWTITLLGGTHVFLRNITADKIYAAFADEAVTHLCGAPIIMSVISDAMETDKREFNQPIRMMTAASPPPPSVIRKMEKIGISVTHVYGLTEVYGPAAVCAEKASWEALSDTEKYQKKARQGVTYELQEDMAVVNSETCEQVPFDGKTIGEIVFRGNITMKGYLKAPEATNEAFRNGWFWTGDLAVVHPDGYAEIRDRSKDIIISGGENISSIVVENALNSHPSVAIAAVVAKKHNKWGEVPSAFIELKPNCDRPSAETLIAHCRKTLAGFQVPKHISFGTLPKTSTGKVQKNILREKVGKIKT